VLPTSREPSRTNSFFLSDGNKVVAAASMDKDPAVAIVAELMQHDQMLTKTQLEEDLKKGKISLLGKL